MKNPCWIEDHLYNYNGLQDVPQSVFDNINSGLIKIQNDNPLVSVVICAWNEEINILRAISSLSRMKTFYPVEIIVVNNNSTDRTQETLDRLHLKSYFQPLQGWGPARQMGLEKARGKYVLIADADAIYPDIWLNEMVGALRHPGVVCVYGRYSFIGDKENPRWLLYIHERMKDMIAAIRDIKRPFLNAYGISMGFVREYAIKVGYTMRNIRGEDGRMCFDLMQFGKVRQMKSNAARAWTYPRVFKKEGSLKQAMINRIVKELNRLPTMFYPLAWHNTKTSTNEN